MTIIVNNDLDIRLSHFGRYYLIRDVSNVFRVVSAGKMKELAPYITSGGSKSYKYATRPGGYQNAWTQSQIANQFADRKMSKTVTHGQLSELQASGVVSVRGNIGPSAVSLAQAASLQLPLGQFNGGYVIGSVSPTGISFASNPKIHTTLEAAETEANRLATTNSGKEFIVFKACMSAVKASVVTRTF